MMILDASVVTDLLLDQPKADRIIGEIHGAGGEMHAPYLLDAEVGHAVRRLVLMRRLSEERGGHALDALSAMRITRYPHHPFLGRAFEMRENVSFYDALYLALAESLGVPLLTADQALGSVPGAAARVIVV